MYPQYPYQQPYPYQYAYMPVGVPPVPDPGKENYRNLRRHSLMVGACLLGYFGLQEIFGLVMTLLGLDEAYLTNPAYQNAVGAFAFSFLAMWVPFFFYSLRKGRPSYIRILPFHSSQPPKKLLLVIVAGWAVCIGGNYVATLVSLLLDNSGVELFSPEPTVSATPLDIAMNFVCAGFMAPLVEEFVFRGVIMQPLRRYGDSFAVFASAFIFAMAHGSPVNITFAFVAGVAIGYAVVYTRSLWVGIIIHALNNCGAVFVAEIERLSPSVVNIAYTAACAAITVSGIICIVIFGKKYGFRLQRDASGVSGGKKVFGFFVTATMVPALLYLFYSMSRYFM